MTGHAAPTPALPRLALIQLGVSVVLLSSGWPLTKQALHLGASPLWFAEGRALLSTLVAFAVMGVWGRLRLPTRADMPVILAVGLLQFAAFFALSHAAVAWVSAGRTAILANTTTIWVVPLSLIFLREPIPPARWVAALLGLAGVCVLVGPWSIDWTSRPQIVGHGLLLGAGLAFTIAMLITRGSRPNLSIPALVPWCFLTASIALAPLAMWREPTGGIGTAPVAWWSLAYIGVIAGPVGTWFVMEAARALPAMVASVGFLLTPAVGLILSNLYLGEALTPDVLAGSALIMAGVGAAAWPRRARG
jgi:O-acetylserine/cysteine efflux transporter